MDIIQKKINERYENNNFINNPSLLKNQQINVVFYKKLQDKKPLISIVTPVFNQENIIVKNIKSVFSNTSNHFYEYILIIDACSDETAKNILSYFSSIDIYPENCTDIIILQSDIPLFETSADNLGFFCSSGEYLLEIQADMEMTEKGYNERLLKPFMHKILREKLLGVSGRCCHGLLFFNGVGKLGGDIEKSISQLNIDRKLFYIGETCNRGPLMLNKKMLVDLKYLDEKNFYLDDSDHDLFARAYYEKHWICGYVPIDFLAPLQDGSTRKPRDRKNTEWLEKRRQESDGGFLLRYKGIINNLRPIFSIKID
jgi:glycosyltransferase involved in cell wall biosynthesis